MENYSTSLDTLFHALSDQTRRTVIGRLTEKPESVKSLAAPFDMALPSFMKHISVLEQAGLIITSKQGRVRTCTLQPHRLRTAQAWLDEQNRLFESRYQNLDQLLGTLKDLVLTFNGFGANH